MANTACFLHLENFLPICQFHRRNAVRSQKIIGCTGKLWQGDIFEDFAAGSILIGNLCPFVVSLCGQVHMCVLLMNKCQRLRLISLQHSLHAVDFKTRYRSSSAIAILHAWTVCRTLIIPLFILFVLLDT